MKKYIYFANKKKRIGYTLVLKGVAKCDAKFHNSHNGQYKTVFVKMCNDNKEPG